MQGFSENEGDFSPGLGGLGIPMQVFSPTGSGNDVWASFYTSAYSDRK
jgi:hypothetical protein